MRGQERKLEMQTAAQSSVIHIATAIYSRGFCFASLKTKPQLIVPAGHTYRTMAPKHSFIHHHHPNPNNDAHPQRILKRRISWLCDEQRKRFRGYQPDRHAMFLPDKTPISDYSVRHSRSLWGRKQWHRALEQQKEKEQKWCCIFMCTPSPKKRCFGMKNHKRKVYHTVELRRREVGRFVYASFFCKRWVGVKELVGKAKEKRPD